MAGVAGGPPRAGLHRGRQAALDTLATVAEEAFSRLQMVEVMGRLARHDSLTGLPNRVLFLDRVEQAVARSRRQGTQIAVLFLDLDGFKSINDRFGHAEGDELLKTVAERLVGCMRAVDSVARLGGDEFAVLVEGVEDLVEIELLCGRMLSALRLDTTIAGHGVVVGGSIGVALSLGDDDGPGLLRNADMAMYRAKALGKDRSFIYEPSLREANIKRLELIEALRAGVASELVVHYQPVVDLDRGRVDGYEALVRWDRGGTLVPPDAFISAAEGSGLIIELGAKVLAQLVADAPHLARAAGRSLNLGCNMSALQLRDPDFAGLVSDAVVRLAEFDCRLVLEMTESIAVADDYDNAEALRTAQAGRRLARDRRLRRRVLVHRLSPAAAGRHHQDRPELHERRRQERACRGAGGGHPGDGRGARSERRRRGHRAGEPGPAAARARLQDRSGISLRPPGVAARDAAPPAAGVPIGVDVLPSAASG